MAKISLGKRPPSFALTVAIPVHTGGTDELTLTCRYRTRTELAAFQDQHNASAKARMDALTQRVTAAREQAEAQAKAVLAAGEAPAEPPAPVSLPTEEEFARAIGESHAEYVLGIAEGWDLEDEFGHDSVLQLVDMHPAAAPAIGEAYSRALREGRLGN